MTARRLVVAAATTVLLAAAAGCGGGGAGDGGDAEPGATSAPSDEPSATEQTTQPADPGDPGDPGDPASYLPVPDGLELTAPGTELPFRDAALVAWTPRQDLVGVVGVQVQRVERTTVARALAGYELTPAEAASTPYFVTALVGNGGTTDLGGRQLPIYVVDSEDRLVAPTGIDPGFDLCPGSVLPAVFAPGDEARSCLLFLVAPDAELEQVMFRPPEGVVPITWSGEVQRLADRGGPGRDRRGGKGRRG